jgi:EpsI family protein
MRDGKLKAEFLNSKHARVLSAVLVLQAVLFYTLSHSEAVPRARPLSGFPTQLGNWTMVNEGVVEKEIRDVLRADDILNRTYAGPEGQAANLFVAYFKTQRAGQAPHSPKNCLPGSGWAPSSAKIVAIPVPGQPKPIQANLYVVSRGTEKSIVLYWYQSHERVIASEYMAKIFLVLDSIRYNRSDTALVRVVVPAGREGEKAATQTATDFVQALFMPLREYLPS